MLIPRAPNITAAKSLYERLDSWKLSVRVLSSYVLNHPCNTDEEPVVIKVVLVNTLYSANVREPLKMAAHILNILDLDTRLKEGQPEAVDSIAKLDKNYVSFASKYAHFHSRTSYPVYDSFVRSALSNLGVQFRSTSYSAFFDDMNQFRQQANLTRVPWEDLDIYLWLYGQKKAMDKGRRDIGKEVRDLYLEPEGGALFKLLDPQ